MDLGPVEKTVPPAVKDIKKSKIRGRRRRKKKC